MKNLLKLQRRLLKEKITLKEATINLGYLNEKEFDILVDPKKMIK